MVFSFSLCYTPSWVNKQLLRITINRLLCVLKVSHCVNWLPGIVYDKRPLFYAQSTTRGLQVRILFEEPHRQRVTYAGGPFLFKGSNSPWSCIHSVLPVPVVFINRWICLLYGDPRYSPLAVRMVILLDWSLYRLSRSLQKFSRGCLLTCIYCGSLVAHPLYELVCFTSL